MKFSEWINALKYLPTSRGIQVGLSAKDYYGVLSSLVAINTVASNQTKGLGRVLSAYVWSNTYFMQLNKTVNKTVYFRYPDY